MNEIEAQFKSLSIPEQDIVDEKTEYDAKVVLESLKRLKKESDELYKPVKQMWQDWRAEKNKIDEIVEPIEDAIKQVSAKISQWVTEQDRLAAIEAEERRIEAQQAHEEERLEYAEQLKEVGETEMAAFVEKQAHEPAAPVKTDDRRIKVKGATAKNYIEYYVDVIDKSIVPGEYLDVNVSRIKQVARALKGDIEIPGVRITKQTVYK